MARPEIGAHWPIESCETADRAMVAMVASAGLPTDDLNAPNQLFKVVRDIGGGGLAAIGGLEIHLPHGLLRSCVVREDRRGEGLARAIVRELLNEARARGLVNAYLLTETAAPFFEQFGFCRIERNTLPPEIAASEQAATLCPDDAVTMKCAL